MPPALRILDRAPSRGARGVMPRFHGPPVHLPGLLDGIAEGWWRLAPRVRATLSVLAVLAALGAVLLRIALSPYGPPTTVLVATVELPAGTVPGPSDIATARWPRGLLPAAAPATRDDLNGTRLTKDITAGTVVTRAHLRDDGPLAGLAAGAAAVPVPTAMLRGVAAGSRVDLVGVAGDGSGRAIAREARVLAVDGDTVWLEVTRERAADVAAAALRGTLSGAVLAE